MVDKIDTSPEQGGPQDARDLQKDRDTPADAATGTAMSLSGDGVGGAKSPDRPRKRRRRQASAKAKARNPVQLCKSMEPVAPVIPIKRARSADRFQPRRAYAAIDLGTNNCRLLIAKPSSDGFVVVDAFSRVVRLGEGLATTGKLSDAAMDRAVAALTVCSEKLKRRHVTLARSVATEACRRASNGDAFIQRVQEETGIVLDVITAEEEARLAVLGCHVLLSPGDGPALIFDIGGGSTELVLVRTDGATPRILDWESAPWGVVSLTESEEFDSNDPAERQRAYRAMRDRVASSFADFSKRLPEAGKGAPRLLGTSGTVTTLASVHLDLPAYDRSAIDGLIVPTDSMREISRELASMSVRDRIALPCIGRERADLVVAGCAILETILDLWPAERLCVADRGIREGILRTLMANDGQAMRKGSER